MRAADFYRERARRARELAATVQEAAQRPRSADAGDPFDGLDERSQALSYSGRDSLDAARAARRVR